MSYFLGTPTFEGCTRTKRSRENWNSRQRLKKSSSINWQIKLPKTERTMKNECTDSLKWSSGTSKIWKRKKKVTSSQSMEVQDEVTTTMESTMVPESPANRRLHEAWSGQAGHWRSERERWKWLQVNPWKFRTRSPPQWNPPWFQNRQRIADFRKKNLPRLITLFQ